MRFRARRISQRGTSYQKPVKELKIIFNLTTPCHQNHTELNIKHHKNVCGYKIIKCTHFIQTFDKHVHSIHVKIVLSVKL